jgi:hypothetical protein
MQAIFLLEANQSTGSVRVALDLRINWASFLWIFRL